MRRPPAHDSEHPVPPLCPPTRRPRGTLRRAARRLGLVAALLASVLALGALPDHIGLRPVHAQVVWSVQAGGDSPDGLFEPTSFFPDSVTVNVGDTVNWTIAGFHTVTFDPTGSLPEDFVPGPNPGEFTFTGAFLPIGPQGPNAVFDGTQPVSSGVPAGPPGQPPAPYMLTFTQPGVYQYFCVVHPGMHGTVTVLPAGSSLPETPDAAQARGQATLQQAMLEAQGAASQVSSTSLALPGGSTVHTVAAGGNVGSDTGASVSLLQFLPASLTVHRGDTVVWSEPDPFELHTVTFTSGAEPPVFPDVRAQPAGPPLFVATANVAGAVGGTTYTGQGYLNSGFLYPGGSVAITIDAPPGTYHYVCLLHGPSMSGDITVVP